MPSVLPALFSRSPPAHPAFAPLEISTDPPVLHVGSMTRWKTEGLLIGPGAPYVVVLIWGYDEMLIKIKNLGKKHVLRGFFDSILLHFF